MSIDAIYRAIEPLRQQASWQQPLPYTPLTYRQQMPVVNPGGDHYSQRSSNGDVVTAQIQTPLAGGVDQFSTQKGQNWLLVDPKGAGPVGTVVQGGGDSFNGMTVLAPTQQLNQTGLNQQNLAEVLGSVKGILQGGMQTTNQASVERVEQLVQGGQSSTNWTEAGDAQLVTMDGTHNRNVVHAHQSLNTAVITGENNRNTLTSITDLQGLLEQGQQNTTLTSIMGRLKQASLVGTQGVHQLAVGTTLGSAQLAGQDNIYHVTVGDGHQQVALEGERNQIYFSDTDRLRMPSLAFAHGQDNTVFYNGGTQDTVVLRGNNNQLTAVMPETPEDGVEAQLYNDKLDVGGNNEAVALLGYGDDLAVVRDTQGGPMELDGGQGNNTLYLEGNDWQALQKLDNNGVRYGRPGKPPVDAYNFQKVFRVNPNAIAPGFNPEYKRAQESQTGNVPSAGLASPHQPPASSVDPENDD